MSEIDERYPNLAAILVGRVSGDNSGWPMVRCELIGLFSELQRVEERVKELDLELIYERQRNRNNVGQADEGKKHLLRCLEDSREKVKELEGYKEAWSQLFDQLRRDREQGHREKTARAWLLMQEFEEKLIEK